MSDDQDYHRKHPSRDDHAWEEPPECPPHDDGTPATKEETEAFLAEMAKLREEVKQDRAARLLEEAASQAMRNEIRKVTCYYRGLRQTEDGIHLLGKDLERDSAKEVIEEIKALRREFPDENPDTWALITVVSKTELIE